MTAKGAAKKMNIEISAAIMLEPIKKFKSMPNNSQPCPPRPASTLQPSMKLPSIMARPINKNGSDGIRIKSVYETLEQMASFGAKRKKI